MATQLTLKERQFVREYVDNGGNGVQAALVVYDTDDYSTAGSIASENLTKPKVQSAMQAALAKLELTEDNIALVVKEAMQANKTVIGTNSATQETVAIETADHHVRLKAAEFTAKLMDAMPMKRSLDGAKRIRQELELSNVPTEVLEFQVQHGRRPTQKERDQLLGVKIPVDNMVIDGENVPAKAAKHSKHKVKRNESS